MKTKSIFFSGKIWLAGAFKASIIAILSIAFVAILMTVASNNAYSSNISKDVFSSYPGSNNDCSTVMDDVQFKNKCIEISGKFFEETRVSLSKELLDHYCLSSAQVKDLMKLFSYDRTRMDFAELAINKVMDPENFAVCKESFMLSANKIVIDDLMKEHSLVGK